LGPTGVGKTELTKVLTELLFGDVNSMIRIDMSEYMEAHSVSKLIGSPPGYVGYEEGGQLTEKIRRKPYSVILFDEIEKAHPDVFNILLQILEDGMLTDSSGRKVDFKNTVIIMTSNIGARLITKNSFLGFESNDDNSNADYEKVKTKVLDELKKEVKPEFLNRIDEIIVFHKLNKENIEEIAKIMLEEVKVRLKAQNISMKISKEALEFIAGKGFDEVYGARPLRRAIQTMVEDEIAEKVLDGEIKKGDKFELKLNNDSKAISIHKQ